MTFAAAVGLGLVVGHWLDGWFETDPLLLVVGGTAGLVAACVHFYFTMTGGKR